MTNKTISDGKDRQSIYKGSFSAVINISIGVLIGLLAAGLILIVASPPRGNPIILMPVATQPNISIFISGAIENPGVYELPPNSRIEDVIAMAGGFSAGADSDAVNLAAFIKDGMQIDIPLQGEIEVSNKVNINTASISNLDSLPGIGPTTAQNIIDYRNKNGLFNSIEDIQGVLGIGVTTYEKIKNQITVGE